ncbi:ankyrin-2-like [Cydia pomonella]|uniref:ankyrin-2-like n=1 Tax=Cydia pomonella TaxID=82600 RepID=UPI002ADE7E65|nr:ankyrin-2-like [Cydia pomonella]
MESPLEDNLYKAVQSADQASIVCLLDRGANPNKITKNGKTSLGEACNIGNISIVKLLVNTTKSRQTTHSSRKRHLKTHKRKIKNDGSQEETLTKYKNPSDRKCMGLQLENIGPSQTSNRDVNRGYFVFIHSDGSSSDESRITSLLSPLSPVSLTPSPQDDLEWDEEIGNVAPTTSEDETWTSMYKWYASILECTGAAIASQSIEIYGIDQQDAFMRTALHYAAERGHAEVVRLLLDAGSKVEVMAGDGSTPLHVAVIKNHPEIVKMLLLAGCHVNNKTHEKMTPLHYAASNGFIDLVKMLVNNGANLEARDTSERTALFLAAGRGHVDVVKYLISVGANVNGEEIHGYTPLCEAVWRRFPEVVEVLLLSRARITHSHKLLHYAIIQRQEEIVKMLANYGGALNLHNDNGDTPLLLAVRLSQPRVARILLEKGAHVNSCNSITGATALHIAVESIDCPTIFEELLTCLLEYRIDMNAIALTGDTALNRALLLHKDHAAVLQIRYGANVNACDLHSCGLDNLSIASRRRSNNLARMLIKAGHHITTPDPTSAVPKQGTTAHWLYHTSRQPHSLSDICRMQIRSMAMKKILFQYISTLPLPTSLRRFLMMEDEGL